MRILRFSEFGQPDVLQLYDVPKPRIQAGEALIEVRAASINMSDIKNVQGAMSQTTLPRVPGRDFSGVVVEGPVELLHKEVWGTGGDLGFIRDGTHAQYLVLPIEAIQEKPKNLSFVEAASVGVSYVTAWSALVDASAMTHDDVVVVVGASGSVGNAALQLTKWLGAFAIGMVRSEKAQHMVSRLGADIVINTQHVDMRKAVFDATHNRGATLVFDTVGGNMFETSLSLLAQKGRLIEISATKERRVSFDLRDFYHREARLFGVDSLQLDVVDCSKILAALKTGFEEGALHPPAISNTPTLEEAVKAYKMVASGDSAGKQVFTLL